MKKTSYKTIACNQTLDKYNPKPEAILEEEDDF